MRILFYDTGDVRGELNEPIGVELLAANLIKKLGGKVTVDMKWFNFDGYSFDPLQYDIIGVSIHINGLDVFDHIYKYCNDCGFKGQIVTGNSIATFAYKELLARYPDIVCMIGEGEDAWVELAREYMGDGTDLSHIPNLAYLDKNRTVITRRTVCDMQEYLPPLRIFNDKIRQNHGISRIEASRGCSWNQCSFCGADHKYNHTGWRPIAIETILRQLTELSDAGLTAIYFCDEDFIGNDSVRFAKLVDKISEKMELREISPDMKFFISVKPADLIRQANMETIKHFMSCGLKELFVGVESGCEPQLRRYNKCTNVKTNSLAVNRIRELERQGLAIDIGFIFFDYNMTPHDVEENISFIASNKLYTLVSSLIKPLRIQPYTKSFSQTPEVHGNPFSMDDLMYQYHFADHTIEQIYNAYSGLDLESAAHDIQSVYRRELSSEAERKLSEKNLMELRFLQFSAIKAIARFYIRGEITEPRLKSDLDTICSRAAQLRQEIRHF